MNLQKEGCKVFHFWMKTKTKNERSRGYNFWDENNNPQKKNT
jgi:hypothetical protein